MCARTIGVRGGLAILLLALAVPAVAQPGPPRPCSWPVFPTTFDVWAAGGTFTVHVNPEPMYTPCHWTAQSADSWIAVTNVFEPPSIDGSFDIVVSPNADAAVRTGHVLVNGVARVLVRQLGVRIVPARYAEIGGPPGMDALLYAPATGDWDVWSRPYPASDMDPLSLTAYGRDAGKWAAQSVVQLADFNGDGMQDVFAYNPTTGEWSKSTNRGRTVLECPGLCSQQRFDIYRGVWGTGWRITVFDANGDGKTDLFLYNPASGRWFIATAAGAGDFAYTEGLWGKGWNVYRARFNRDRLDDLFLYNSNTSADPNSGRWFKVMSLGNGTFAYEAGAVRWAPGWTITPGDYNGDGLTDLFLYGYANSGQWFLVDFPEGGATRYRGSAWMAGWTIKAGDFNGDGLDDLFVYNPGNGGGTGLWAHVFSNGDGTFNGRGGDIRWAGGWQFEIADINDDGLDDVFLNDPADGRWVQVFTDGAGVHYNYGAASSGVARVTPYRPFR